MPVATTEMQDCPHDCFDCAARCEACAARCCAAADSSMAECANLCLDCAKLCIACSSLMNRESALKAQVCTLCAQACDRCTAECEKHSDRDFCRECAEACRQCAGSQQRDQQSALTKRRSELKAMQDRLLNAFLVGTVDEETFNAKQAELRDEQALVDERVAETGCHNPADVAAALAVFDFRQNAAEIWRGSNMPEQREIVESLSLNRTVGHLILALTKRKPFDGGTLWVRRTAVNPVESGRQDGY